MTACLMGLRGTPKGSELFIYEKHVEFYCFANIFLCICAQTLKEVLVKNKSCPLKRGSLPFLYTFILGGFRKVQQYEAD